VTLDEVAGRLEAEARDRVFATGGQAYVSVGGEVVLDVAFGVDALDRPVEPDTLFAVYCAGKPVFAVALAALMADGELSIDDRVGDVLTGAGDHLAPLEVGSLLDHTAGLHRLSSTAYVASPPAVRDALALGVRPPEGWPGSPESVGYSEMAAWHVLGLAATALTGTTAADLVRKRVTEPIGAGDLFVAGMTEGEYTAHRGRIGVNAQISGLRTDPLLAERTRRLRCLPTPAVGNTASARGLGRFYEAVLAALGTGAVAPQGPLAGLAAHLPDLVTPHSHGFDATMGRTCGYGHGFMVRLSDHQFGRRVGARAFGHSGFGGMTGAFADPDHALVVAFHLNGRVDDESALDVRRPALVDGIYRAVVGEAAV
jgi:CubicO group peptidase (beta-lactamase class C family)